MNNVFLNMKLPNTITKEEISYLFNNFNEENRQKLINGNLRLVANEIMNVFKTDYDIKLELFQIGTEGLINAIDHYDITKNVSFSTYAKKCIDNAIIAFLKSKNSEIKMKSLYEPLIEFEDNTELLLQDTIVGDNDFTDTIDNIFSIEYLLSKLSERNRKIIILHFGLFNNISMKEKELAKMFNTSKSNISYIIIESLKKMKILLEIENEKIKKNTKTII